MSRPAGGAANSAQAPGQRNATRAPVSHDNAGALQSSRLGQGRPQPVLTADEGPIGGLYGLRRHAHQDTVCGRRVDVGHAKYVEGIAGPVENDGLHCPWLPISREVRSTMRPNPARSCLTPLAVSMMLRSLVQWSRYQVQRSKTSLCSFIQRWSCVR